MTTVPGNLITIGKIRNEGLHVSSQFHFRSLEQINFES